jgi:phosphate transport system protein
MQVMEAVPVRRMVDRSPARKERSIVSKHLVRDMENLHTEILSLSAMVEEMIDKAMRALCERRYDLAGEVVEADEQIDQREVHIEDECLKMLALHQPVAIDLRRIATVMKVNNDLERIADLAVNIAERAQCLSDHAEFPIPLGLKRMVTLATHMVRSALNAFVNLDAHAAREILVLDEQVDQYNVEVIDRLQQAMRADPENVAPALHCFSAARHIERIADHATNIAEDVIYLVEGEIVRHMDETPRPTG